MQHFATQERQTDTFWPTREALWAIVAGLGDRDTTCAIVGSMVVLVAGHEGLPPKWLIRREPLE